MEPGSRLGAGLTVMALLRAIESCRPEGERLFDDRFSRGLLPAPWKVFLLPGLRHAVAAVVEARGPGGLGNLLCRTRYIDDTLRDALKAGSEQVIILGAGFDARAYRIRGIDQCRVFEVDLPGPQGLKQAPLLKVFGTLASHVVFVPIDFNRQTLEDVMGAAGFRACARTFFVWEGVTQYISAEAVDATLKFVSGASAGSGIVFTYVHRGIIDGYARSETDEQLMGLARSAGTPWIFGLDPAELEEYLAARGLTFVEQVSVPEYRARYLEPRGREMNVFWGEKVVLARVD